MDRTARGFTLVEGAIVMVIVAALAALAAAGFNAAKRNGTVASAAFDLSLRAQALKMKALNEQVDYLLVVVNAADGTGTGCGFVSSANCVQAFVLSAPTATWTLAAFNPSSPAVNASVYDTFNLPAGLAFDLASAGTAGPAPFDQVKAFDPAVKGTCSSRACVAVRFGANGEVGAAYAAAAPAVAPQGLALALTTDASLGRGDRRSVLVSFPTGIVKLTTY